MTDPQPKKSHRWLPFLAMAVALVVGIGIGNIGKVPASSVSEIKADLADARAEIADLHDRLSNVATDTTPTPAPPAAPATITFEGQGDGNSSKQSMSGDYTFAWQTLGDCAYYADLEDDGGSLFSADAALSGSGNIYDVTRGDYYIQMITGPAPSCGWTITFTPA